MRAFFWLFAALVAAVLISFAVSNLKVVSLGLWPLPWRVETWLFLIAFAGLGLGFVAGEAHAWIGRHRLKRDLHRRTREIESLQHELAARKVPSEDPLRGR